MRKSACHMHEPQDNSCATCAVASLVLITADLQPHTHRLLQSTACEVQPWLCTQALVHEGAPSL